MKKLLIFIISIIFSCNLFAQPFIEGKHYIRITKHIKNIDPIIEFFSFFCQHCYQFEKKFHLNTKMKNILSSKKKIKMYHVNVFDDKINDTLTHIWQMAVSIHSENKIIIPIFKLIHENQFNFNQKNIKKIFIKNTHITEKKYNLLWNSYIVNKQLFDNKKLLSKIYLQYIPTILINGEYIINNESLYATTDDQFINQYISLVKYLLKKNNF